MSRSADECAICGETDCRYEPSKLYWHEALDRAHVACDHFYEYVQHHPAVQHDEELEEMATQVVDKMQEFYQAVGRKSYEFKVKAKGGGGVHDI